MTEQPPARSIPPWVRTLVVVATLGALIVWSFLQRWEVLSASPFPLGVDGYFYPVQLRSLFETGELQYPASPLAFWLLAPFAAATDPITGAKLGAAVLGALVALPAYAVGAQLGRGEDDGRGPGLVAAAIATSSAGSMYLTIEFVKNGIGLTVALAALWLILRCFDSPTRWRIGAAALGVVAAVLAHKMAAAIVIGIAIPAALVEASARRVGTSPATAVRAMAIPLGVAAIFVAGWVAVGAIAPRRFVSTADLELIDGLFTSDAAWSLPVLGNGKLRLSYEPVIAVAIAASAIGLLMFERTSRSRRALGGVMLVIVGLAVLGGCLASRNDLLASLGGTAGLFAIAAGIWIRRTASRMTAPTAELHHTDRAGVGVVTWSVIGLALFIGLPWLDVSGPQGLGMRLRIVAFVPLALCAAVVVRAGMRYVVRDPTQRFGACVVLALTVIAVRVGGGPRTEGQVITHPALIAGSQALSGRIPDGDTAIVPERHIAYMIAWYARARISTRPESIAVERRWRVLPLAFIRRNTLRLDEALIGVRARSDLPRVIGLHPSHPNGLVLVPERTWQAVLEMLPDAERARLEVWPTI